MNGKKKILLISLLTAGAAVGFGCPAALSWVQDFQIERQSELLDGDTIRLTMKSSLSTAQRLWLVNYYSSSVQLDTGQNMTQEEAKKQVVRELEKFNEPVGEMFLTEDCSVESCQTYLRMAEDASASSLVIWDFWLRDQKGNSAEVILDDETGNVLGISCYSKYRIFQSSEEDSDQEQIATEALLYGLDSIGAVLLEYISDYYPDIQYIESYVTEISEEDISYALAFQDTDGRQYEFPVTVTENAFFFNL